MCWSRESSLIGFILNTTLLFFHYNKPSQKLIPIFITVALTQFFDFLIYSGYDKNVVGKLLGIDLSLQVLFIYQALNLPIFCNIIPLILFYLYLKWEPYKNYKNLKGPISWNENNNSKMYLFLIWILIPILHIIKSPKNKKDLIFLITAMILLFGSDNFNFGSVGKNWCMLGIILNILTLLFYNSQ